MVARIVCGGRLRDGSQPLKRVREARNQKKKRMTQKITDASVTFVEAVVVANEGGGGTLRTLTANY